MGTEQLNERAKKTYMESKWQKGEYEKYGGNVIKGDEIWVTDVGRGCEKVD